MKSISAADFAERLLEGARVFDTRPLLQVERDPLPGAEHLSLERVQAGELPELAPDEPVYLVCERGMMSDLVGLYLEAAGMSEVYNVEGGLAAWRRLGREGGDNEPG